MQKVGAPGIFPPAPSNFSSNGDLMWNETAVIALLTLKMFHVEHFRTGRPQEVCLSIRNVPRGTFSVESVASSVRKWLAQMKIYRNRACIKIRHCISTVFRTMLRSALRSPEN